MYIHVMLATHLALFLSHGTQHQQHCNYNRYATATDTQPQQTCNCNRHATTTDT